MNGLSPADLESFHRHGYHLARGLLRREDIAAVLRGVDVMLCAQSPGLKRSQGDAVFEEIHGKILDLQQRDRAALSRVYDAMRKLLPFWALLGGEAVGAEVRALLGCEEVGLAFRGAGIRLDIPGEDRWRSAWHQEYHAQMSSLHGVVCWFNLVGVKHEMGPVRVAEGSHVEGLLPVQVNDALNKGKDYTTMFEMPGIEDIVAKYPVRSFETEVGDVLFLDFLTLHESGWNRSPKYSRITCQARYFDVCEPTGIKNAWKGGFQEGGDFTQLHPDKVQRVP